MTPHKGGVIFSLLLSSFFVLDSFSALVPMESLFRNASNGEIKRNSAALRLRVRELREENPFEESRLSRRQLWDRQYSIIFTKNKRNKNIEFLQVEYEGNPSGKKSIESLKVTRLYESKSFSRLLSGRKNQDLEKNFFWAAIAGIILNNSKIMNSFLKKTNADYKTNPEVVNQALKTIYRRYMGYLRKIKESPELEATLISPLSPMDQEEKKKVRELLKMPFYMPTNKVSLIKEGDDFFLLLRLEKVLAKFTNKDFKLVELGYHDLIGDVSLKFFDYAPLFEGYTAPKNIIWSSVGKRYHIQILSLKYVNYKSKTMAKMKKSFRQRYGKSSRKRKRKQVEFDRPKIFF
ncbi:MAG: hypothetical protein OXB88_08255 [Bacteriovoracales bacterium]|nr:hypothetical protein [Bacteriovoracales bacterium]